VRIFTYGILVKLIAAFLFLVQSANAQVNTEKFRKYDQKEGFLFNLQTTFTIKSGNTEYNALKAGGRLDHSSTNFDYFLVSNFEFKSASGSRIQNQGFVHLRGIWKFDKKANWEYFAQRQYDEFIDLRYRDLLGTSIKYRVLKTVSKKDSATVFLLNASTGVMFEHENYNSEPENIDKQLVRATNFISFDWAKKDLINLTGVVYYQPALENFSDYRLAAETTLEFNIIRKLFFSINFNYKYNNRPVNNVKPYDLSLENGLRLKL